MATDSYYISFFFGAGASAEFGIPTMKRMATEFRNVVNDSGNATREQEIYNEIIESLGGDMGENMDIEAIFSVIDGLQEYELENIGELSLYLSRRFLHDTLVNREVYPREELRSLESKFQRFIRNSCRLRSQFRGRMVDTYTSFFNAIAEASQAPLTTPSNIKYDNRWTMFTTNYDRCLEAFWRENLRINLDTGFSRSTDMGSAEYIFKPDNFLYSYGSEIPPLKNVPGSSPRLVKLHGSITWLKRQDSGEIEETIYHLDQGIEEIGAGNLYESEVIIYPLRQKQLYVSPYIQMFYLLNVELKLRKVWVVIGYSFRDPVIQNIFISNFSEEKRMILIHPHPEDVTMLFPNPLRGRIITINNYFGREGQQDIINARLRSELQGMQF